MLYDPTTLYLNGTRSCADFIDVTMPMGDVYRPTVDMECIGLHVLEDMAQKTNEMPPDVGLRRSTIGTPIHARLISPTVRGRCLHSVPFTNIWSSIWFQSVRGLGRHDITISNAFPQFPVGEKARSN